MSCYGEESIFNLLPREEIKAEKAPRYRSKFDPKQGIAYSTFKETGGGVCKSGLVWRLLCLIRHWHAQTREFMTVQTHSLLAHFLLSLTPLTVRRQEGWAGSQARHLPEAWHGVCGKAVPYDAGEARAKSGEHGAQGGGASGAGQTCHGHQG